MNLVLIVFAYLCCRSMARTTVPLNFNVFLEKAKLKDDGSNYMDWLHNLRIICRCSGNGGPQTCLPTAYGVALRGAQHGPSSSTQIQDPREGPSLAGQTTRSFLRHGLIRLAREEAV